MITLYNKKATDYTTNGLVVLDPYIISAKISERLNGEYKLDMELAVDQRTMIAANEMIIKAPAPIRETPQIDVESTQTVTREIYKVTTGGQRLYLRVKPSQSARGIHAYKPGTEVAILDKSNSQWYKVAVLYGGASGYMYAANLTYVRSETQSQGANRPQTITTPAKTRDQLFRISKITSTLESIQIEALHISYDMRRNYVKSAAVKGKTGTDALAAVFAAAMTASDFTLYSDIGKACEEDIAGKSLVAALLSDGGLVDQAGGEVLRDNYDLYWYNNIGYDRGVSIAYRKNMAGMEIGVNTSDIVTQIVPVGYDKKNNPIYGEPVDSAHAAEYAHPYIKEYAYKDVKVGKDYKNESAVKTELAKRAAAEYDAKIDLPKVSATVEYVDIKNTSVGRDFAAYTNVYIGDTVRIRHEDYGFDLVTKVVAYVWDCVVNEYESIELDNKQAQLSDIKINPSMIGNGTLASRKLGVGAVMNVNMAENSVESDQIAEGAIDNTNKMTQLVVDALSAEAVTAIRADIRQLVAGQITTDQLYVDLAAIAVAQITAANIEKANIDWAEIKNLTAAIADIANANIGTAKIDWAKIYDLTADTAIITEGVGGKLYIARLAVTEANMTSLTVGELMVKAEDGSFKRLTVGADGNVSAETVQVEGGNVADSTISGGKLIENTITARELNVESIFADKALIRAIKAANIDVSDLFAAEATIDALDSWLIKADTIAALQGQLNFWASDKITAAVSAVQVGGTNLVTLGDLAIVNATGRAAEYIGKNWYRESEHQTTISPYSGVCWLQCPNILITAGRKYTLSYYAWIQPGATTGAVKFRPNLFGGTSDTDKYLTDYIPFVIGTPTKYTVTFDTTGWTTGTYTLRFVMMEGQTHEVYFTDVKLEEGTKATAWSPNPNEIRLGTNILLDLYHTLLKTPYFEVDVSGENGDFKADETGLSAKVGTFAVLNAPNVARYYTGPASITLSAGADVKILSDALSNRILTGDVTIDITGEVSSALELRGIGGYGRITINGGGNTLNGYINLYCNSVPIEINSVKVSRSTQRQCINVNNCTEVKTYACVFNANASSGNAQGFRSTYSGLFIQNCEFYNIPDSAMAFSYGTDALVLGCKGAATYCFWYDGATLRVAGSRPSGICAGGNPSFLLPSDPSTVTVDTGSATPVVTPVTTASYTATTTGTYYPSGHWINSDNYIRQGFEGKTSTRKDYGCMWFNAGALAGKTIKSATLTLTRRSGKGRSSSVTVTLWTTTLTGKSGKPTDSMVSLGEIGKIQNGETATFSIPTSAISVIAAGGGLVTYTGETANAENKDYSPNYAHFYGVDTDGPAPVLTVTYQ